MNSEWHKCKWGNLATLEYGKGIRGYESATGSFPVYGTNGHIGWHSEPLCYHAGVVIGRKGAYRGVHYVPSPFYVIDTAFYLRPKADVELDLQWAFYELLTHDINSMDSGSAIPSTSRENFYQLPVDLPPLSEQKAISRVLRSLDDKIELNRRMNATLEKLAQTLFRAWFVDFEPVKAKAAGVLPHGMDAETAALFPSEFDRSTPGLIPKGWEVQKLDEAFEINPTRRSPGSTYLDMSSVPTQGHRPSGWVQRAPKSGMKFINGDTLLARITPCLENGKTAFVDFLGDGEVGWGSTEFIVLRPRAPLPEYFAYLLCRYDNFRNFAIQSMTGTSGRQRVQVTSLGQYSLAIPGEEICDRFAQIIQPIVSQIARNSEQSQTLAQLRDTLLPRLISGRLRVPDVLRGVALDTLQ